MATDDPQFRLRLPEDLHEKIRAVAALNGRTINGEVVARLRESFEAHMPQKLEGVELDLRDMMRDAMNDTLERLLTEPSRLAQLYKIRSESEIEADLFKK